jgi:hypothetical protein
MPLLASDIITIIVRYFRSVCGTKVLPMKTKVICGRSPILGVGRSKTSINSWNENGGVVVRPSGRRNSLVLAALRLIARKIRDKE